MEAVKEELTRKIWGYVYFLHNISTEWGVVLLDPNFDHEPELRNRAFAIWIWGFAENAAESINRLNHLRRLAQQIDAQVAIYYVNLIEKLHAGVADVLSPLSFEDMSAPYHQRRTLRP